MLTAQFVVTPDHAALEEAERAFDGLVGHVLSGLAFLFVVPGFVLFFRDYERVCR